MQNNRIKINTQQAINVLSPTADAERRVLASMHVRFTVAPQGSGAHSLTIDNVSALAWLRKLLEDEQGGWCEPAEFDLWTNPNDPTDLAIEHINPFEI